MTFDIPSITDALAKIVLVATVGRIALHWARGMFEIWVPVTESRASKIFWGFYSKLELTLSYAAGSLAAYGRQKIEGELSAPVAQSLNPAEGKIK